MQTKSCGAFQAEAHDAKLTDGVSEEASGG